jgi:hypothetical protein
MDKETENLLREVVGVLERSAVANEKLLELAESEQMQFEHGPTVCPGCGKLNPQVTILAPEPGQDGHTDEFIMKFESHCCNRVLFGVPVAWNLVDDIDLATDIMNQKGGG